MRNASKMKIHFEKFYLRIKNIFDKTKLNWKNNTNQHSITYPSAPM